MPLIDPTYAAGSGWTVQNVAQTLLFGYPAFTGSHSSPQTISPAELALSDGTADTYTVTTREVDLTGASVLPPGFSLNATTGVITTDGVNSAAGSYVIGLAVTSGLGLAAETDVIIGLT